jgi:hypothetical protein
MESEWNWGLPDWSLLWEGFGQNLRWRSGNVHALFMAFLKVSSVLGRAFEIE